MERYQRTMKEILADLDLDDVIEVRFRMERRPERTVDGDDPWDRDLFEEPDDA